MKNSPLSCARCFENSARKYSLMRPNTSPEAVRSASESKARIISSRTSSSKCFVVLRQLPGKRWKMLFHGVHGGSHVGAESAVLRHLQQHVIACRLGQHQGAAALEIILQEGAVRHTPGSLVGFDRLQRCVIAVRRMAQEDEAQDGHEVFVRREVRIGSQTIRDLPEVRLEQLDTDKVIRNHSSVVFPMFFSIEAVPVACGALSGSYSSTANTTTAGYPC